MNLRDHLHAAQQRLTTKPTGRKGVVLRPKISETGDTNDTHFAPEQATPAKESIRNSVNNLRRPARQRNVPQLSDMTETYNDYTTEPESIIDDGAETNFLYDEESE